MSRTIEELAEALFDGVGMNCDTLHDAIDDLWLSIEEQFADLGYSVEMPEEILGLLKILEGHSAVFYEPAEMLTRLNAEVSNEE